MNKSLFILALLGAIIAISGCKKEDDAIDKFVGTFSGEYRLWDCGLGGPANNFLTVENSTLSITKTGSETAEITCDLPVFGQVFKCQGTMDSDSTLNMPGCVQDGVTYEGKYLLRSNGNKALHLFVPDVNCTFLSSPIGNVVWTKNN